MRTIPNCSKAPRGLFVQVELGRVFTAIAISPSERLRQLLARDAIHAGRNSKLSIVNLYVAIEFRLYHNPSFLLGSWRIVVEDSPDFSEGLSC